MYIEKGASAHRPKVKVWSHKMDVRDCLFPTSSAAKDVNMSTTLTSSFYSGFKTSDEVSEITQTGDYNLRKLKKRIYQLENANKSLTDDLRNWQDRYSDLKEQRESVKVQVIEDIRTQILKLQSRQSKQESDKYKAKFEKLNSNYNKILSEKFEYSERLKSTEAELSRTKQQYNDAKEAMEKEKLVLEFTLARVIKQKLSDPIVRYLIGSVSKNPLGL